MKKTIRGAIAANVKRYMTNHPYAGTEATLAAHSAIPKVKITRILAGTIDCDVDMIAALADALGVQSSDLLAEPTAGINQSDIFRDTLLHSLPKPRPKSAASSIRW